jgi:hypothetical protein
MTDEPKDDPARKMRKLLGGTSPINRLPKRNSDTASFLPKSDEEKKDAPSELDVTIPKAPTRRPLASTLKPKLVPVPNGNTSIFGPRFWTIASIISLTVNGILVIVLIVLLIGLNSYGLSVSYMMNMGNNLLGGLYGNFEKMDRAHIQANIEVNTTIPVRFDLALNQQTNVVLSQDVTINNALVTVNTGGLNITRANTTIVLPQGTILPILLNLTVPVNTTVPVTLDVPVDIPLSQTQLHEPFAGLQEVIRPLYCLVNPNAFNLDGEPICR